jgi:hypothetical protein
MASCQRIDTQAILINVIDARNQVYFLETKRILGGKHFPRSLERLAYIQSISPTRKHFKLQEK